MRIHNEFTVPASSDRVWTLLGDLDQVAPCMPGAALVGRADDGSHRGRFKIKVGPVSAAYEGVIRIVNRDEASGIIVLRAEGSDVNGAGSAEATITGQVRADGDGAQVALDTDLEVAGKLAQFSGRSSLMQDVADRIVRQFADRLRTRATQAAAPGPGGGDQPSAPPQAVTDNEPLDAGSVVRDMIAERVGGAGGVLVVLASLIVGIALGRATRRRQRRIEVRF